MDFICLIDKLLTLKSNLRDGYDLEIHLTNSLTIRLLDERTRKSTLIDKTKLSAISCECTEIYNRVHNALKPHLDDILLWHQKKLVEL